MEMEMEMDKGGYKNINRYFYKKDDDVETPPSIFFK